MCIDIPLANILADPSAHLDGGELNPDLTVLVCRLGNDSQIACEALRSVSAENPEASPGRICDLVGGLRSWSKEVDPDFPIY